MIEVLGLGVDAPAWAVAEKVKSLGFAADVGVVERPWGLTTVIRLVAHGAESADQAIIRGNGARALVRVVEFLLERGGTVHLLMGTGSADDAEPISVWLEDLPVSLPTLAAAEKRLVHVLA